MKKLLALVLTLVMIVGVLASCTAPAPDPEPEAPKVGEIKLEANGGTVTGFDGKYTVGDYVFLPTPVAPKNQTFTGWYSDAALTTKVENVVKTSVEGDVKLYAGYVYDLLKPDGSAANNGLLMGCFATSSVQYARYCFVDNKDGSYTYTYYDGFDNNPTRPLAINASTNGGTTGEIFIDRAEHATLEAYLGNRDADTAAQSFVMTIELGLDKDATKVLPMALHNDGGVFLRVTGVAADDGKYYVEFKDATNGWTKVAELKKGEMTSISYTVTFEGAYNVNTTYNFKKCKAVYTMKDLTGADLTNTATGKRVDVERVERILVGQNVWKWGDTSCPALTLAAGETASIVVGQCQYVPVATAAAN